MIWDCLTALWVTGPITTNHCCHQPSSPLPLLTTITSQHQAVGQFKASLQNLSKLCGGQGLRASMRDVSWHSRDFL